MSQAIATAEEKLERWNRFASVTRHSRFELERLALL